MKVGVTDTQIVELGFTHRMLRGRTTLGHYLHTVFVDHRRLRRMYRRSAGDCHKPMPLYRYLQLPRWVAR